MSDANQDFEKIRRATAAPDSISCVVDRFPLLLLLLLLLLFVVGAEFSLDVASHLLPIASGLRHVICREGFFFFPDSE